MKILLTGSAGFIGFHTALRLIRDGHEVIGLDNLNDYYDVRLKYGRLEQSGISRDPFEYNRLIQSVKYPEFRFIRLNLEDKDNLHDLMKEEKLDRVCHLGAQAGVRYSLVNPYAYLDSNITGTLNILEGCRQFGTEHLVYASSSSVYGLNTKMPFSTAHNVDHPVSLYAATKKSNELMAHTYSHLYGIPTTGLRFFTVYGPWGRPDMALFIFTKAILEGHPIDVFNHGKMKRDFTYINDIVDGVVSVLYRAPQPDPSWSSKDGDTSRSSAPYKIYNIGNNQPVELDRFISIIEEKTGLEAKKHYLDMQPGDVVATWADVDDLQRDFNYHPDTDLEYGLGTFVDWYRDFYGI